MHHQYVDRQFLLAMLSIPIILCLTFITNTPTTLVGLAGGMVIIGILGWFYSKDLPSPWIICLVSTVMIVLGAAFLIWYFSIGRTLLHPIVDVEKIFESMQKSLVTPTP
mgnify:CR=1 FL=1